MVNVELAPIHNDAGLTILGSALTVKAAIPEHPEPVV
jgi:hypothetical protein